MGLSEANMEYQFESEGAILAFTLHEGEEVRYRKGSKFYDAIVIKCCPKKVKISTKHNSSFRLDIPRYVKPENIYPSIPVYREVRRAVCVLPNKSANGSEQ
jgi:hypothetical protein